MESIVATPENRKIFDKKLISLQDYIAQMAQTPILDMYSPRALNIAQRLDSYYPYQGYVVPQIDAILQTPIHLHPKNFVRIIIHFEKLQRIMSSIAQDIAWNT